MCQLGTDHGARVVTHRRLCAQLHKLRAPTEGGTGCSDWLRQKPPSEKVSPYHSWMKPNIKAKIFRFLGPASFRMICVCAQKKVRDMSRVIQLPPSQSSYSASVPARQDAGLITSQWTCDENITSPIFINVLAHVLLGA